MATTLQAGAKARAIIKGFEGCEKRQPNGSFLAYPDPATGGAPWTIGWGSTGPDIKRGTVWSQAQCDARFERDLVAFAAQIAALLGTAPTDADQFDAMVSLAYNIGVDNFRSSTLLRLHRAGDHTGAAAQFARWNKANGKVMAGLTRRRTAEAAAYQGRSFSI
ncbi:GH24 family phage-related lysozyme (muramidase) [Sphingomonas kyeonggiensis]|uniref:Lysozyme n=1 Tax=Sphingomonas kyeonggiensis TaxID=1268553 RepID=A0A7W7JXR0_9SPHN|nr:lysozyme [Sphingomonas kyeonggiensis]MBB4837307.1 GH24 family phage-related lysozyme (muramidase) [Sphingomonas kyeonggiensis]